MHDRLAASFLARLRSLALLAVDAEVDSHSVIARIMEKPYAWAQPIQGRAPQSVQDQYVPDPPGVSVETWVSGYIPWSMLFMPDGRALVSERRGQIRLIDAKGQLAQKPYAALQVVAHGEGGLMGLALHQQFAETPFVYVMLTRSERGGVANAVVLETSRRSCRG